MGEFRQLSFWLKNKSHAASTFFSRGYAKEPPPWDPDAVLNVEDVKKTWKNDPLRALRHMGDEGVENLIPVLDQIHKLHVHFIPELTSRNPFDNSIFLYSTRKMALTIGCRFEFELFYAAIILCHAVLLGLQADETISDDTTYVIECIFTFLYIFELVIRIFCVRGPPWESFALWFDGILVLASCVDLWFFLALESLGVMKRPNISVMLVLRLFRISRLFMAARAIAEVARTIRVLRSFFRTAPGLSAGLVGAAGLFIFASGVIMRSTVTEDSEEQVVENYFPTVGQSMVSFCLITAGSPEWRDTIRLPLALFNTTGVVMIVTFALILRKFLGSIVLSVITEHMLKAGMRDDDVQRSAKIRSLGHFKRIARAFHLMDLNRDGHLTEEEICIVYDTCKEQNKDLEQYLGISKIDALALHYMLLATVEMKQPQGSRDHTLQNAVPIGEFITAMFDSHCSKKDIESLLFEHQLQLCETASSKVLSGAWALGTSIYNNGGDAGDDEQPASGLRDNYDSGLSNVVSEFASDALVNRVVFDSQYEEVAEQLDSLEKHLDNIISVMNHTNWDDEASVSEGAIKLASLQFIGELMNCNEDFEAYFRKMREVRHAQHVPQHRRH